MGKRKARQERVTGDVPEGYDADLWREAQRIVQAQSAAEADAAVAAPKPPASGLKRRRAAEAAPTPPASGLKKRRVAEAEQPPAKKSGLKRKVAAAATANKGKRRRIGESASSLRPSSPKAAPRGSDWAKKAGLTVGVSRDADEEAAEQAEKRRRMLERFTRRNEALKQKKRSKLEELHVGVTGKAPKGVKKSIEGCFVVNDSKVIVCACKASIAPLTRKIALDKAWEHAARCSACGPLPLSARRDFFTHWKGVRASQRQ
eukprot:TRINITY_DN12861_c0_g1_i1.p2 TRINITY_DN12861_c0_g1~~TRINITY_DN12861_c0_g1_i1.p2  ORF type:complete len:260 (+),score=26.83 TRINITY_DN12861_c0_g1_i1:64-843(+)